MHALGVNWSAALMARLALSLMLYLGWLCWKVSGGGPSLRLLVTCFRDFFFPVLCMVPTTLLTLDQQSWTKWEVRAKQWVGSVTYLQELIDRDSGQLIAHSPYKVAWPTAHPDLDKPQLLFDFNPDQHESKEARLHTNWKMHIVTL